MRNLIGANTLIRDTYRALLNTDRTYASFEPRHSKLLNHLKDRGEIFDPMSGYGGLMNFCSQSDYKFSSFNIEFNPPAYYWQVLMNPQNINIYKNVCDAMLTSSELWPSVKSRVAISDNWFPEESLELLIKLWDVIEHHIENCSDNSSSAGLVAAFLLPFSGRLSSSIRGNVVTHIKKGGMCPYFGWKDDFKLYIHKLASVLDAKSKSCKNFFHNTLLGDARDCDLGSMKFSAMLTSPPYPNTKDYTKMFAPENSLIKQFQAWSLLPETNENKRSIGSSDVSKKNGHSQKEITNIQSNSAVEFINYIESYDKTKRAINDNKTYYLPYFCNYFCDMEESYKNISKYLADDFVGYIVVVNNTARKKVIPVSDFICETWQRLGFNVEIDDELSEELSHVGGLNPSVKGLSARHMEQTLRIYR